MDILLFFLINTLLGWLIFENRRKGKQIFVIYINIFICILICLSVTFFSNYKSGFGIVPFAVVYLVGANLIGHILNKVHVFGKLVYYVIAFDILQTVWFFLLAYLIVIVAIAAEVPGI